MHGAPVSTQQQGAQNVSSASGWVMSSTKKGIVGGNASPKRASHSRRTARGSGACRAMRCRKAGLHLRYVSIGQVIMYTMYHLRVLTI